jgi:hypothetical protein
MPLWLEERLTFDKLFRISDPKRVYRSFTVRGPPLEIDSYQDVVYYIFNFKSSPSTTGLRHRGYVKFFKPKNKSPKSVPLQHLDCLVDCTCPDFRYRWAWANKQRQSSVVGPNSLNQAWNKAPRKTNPSGKPGLCKHILAARQYIYGLMSAFPGDEPDTAYKLDRLTKYATKRWTDFEGQMQAAKEREKEIRRRREQRNLGQLPLTPPPLPAASKAPASTPVRPVSTEPSVDAVKSAPQAQKPKATTAFKSASPEPLPTDVTAKKPATPQQKQVSVKPALTPTSKPKRVIGNRIVQPYNPSDKYWIKPEEALLCVPIRDIILESVVSANGKSMSNIKEAIKLVEELEADEIQLGDEMPATDMGLGSDIGGETLEPSEPAVSDSAIGADTEGDTALSLLRSIKTSLEQIAAAVAPVDALPAPGEAGEGVEGAEEAPMPGMPPADLGAEAAAEGETPEEEEAEHEDDEAEAEAEGEEKE